jgi:hypothetical protein
MNELFSGITDGPFRKLLDVLALPAESLLPAVVMLSSMAVVSYLLRTAIMMQAPHSRVAHMVACTLTLLPAIILAAVLVWAASQHPGRAWTNLLVAAAIYVAWGLGGTITRLARPDTEGADIGWITMGALITFPVGVIAAVICG